MSYRRGGRWNEKVGCLGDRRAVVVWEVAYRQPIDKAPGPAGDVVGRETTPSGEAAKVSSGEEFK